MANNFTHEQIQQSIREKYANVAHTSAGMFNYPTGEAGARKLGYDSVNFDELPEELLSSFCGVGNPFSLGSINEGEVVLDIGCGAGFDLFVASTKVGKLGKVCGIDITPQMVEKAKANLEKTNCEYEVKVASSEQIPYPNDTFDVITSNGVLNLSPLKEETFKEIYRVLKPGGRFQFADIILKADLPEKVATSLDSWSN